MSAIRYYAKRNIDASRSAGTEYSFDVALTAFTRQVERKEETATSLSGIRFTTLHRLDQGYQVTTAPINDSAILTQMREFLDSVAGGETFYIDPFGSVLTPNNEYQLVLNGNYSETLVDLSGFYSFSFKVLQQ